MSESGDSDRNGWGKDKSEERRSRERDRVDKRDKDPENFTQIYIAKLSSNTRDGDIREAFSKFG